MLQESATGGIRGFVEICMCVCTYLQVSVWVDVLLFHQLFDLFTPLHQLPDLFGQDSHVQVGVWDLRDLLGLVFLLPWKQQEEVSSNKTPW